MITWGVYLLAAPVISKCLTPCKRSRSFNPCHFYYQTYFRGYDLIFGILEPRKETHEVIALETSALRNKLSPTTCKVSQTQFLSPPRTPRSSCIRYPAAVHKLTLSCVKTHSERSAMNRIVVPPPEGSGEHQGRGCRKNRRARRQEELLDTIF